MKINIRDVKIEKIVPNKVQKYWERLPYPTIIALGEMMYAILTIINNKCSSVKKKYHDKTILIIICQYIVNIFTFIMSTLPVPDKYRYSVLQTLPLDNVDEYLNYTNYADTIITPNNTIKLIIDYPLQKQYITEIKHNHSGFSLKELIIHTVHEYRYIYTTPAEDDNISIEKGTEDKVFDGSNDKVLDGSNDKVLDGSTDKVLDGSNDKVLDGSTDKVLDGSNDKVLDGSNDKVKIKWVIPENIRDMTNDTILQKSYGKYNISRYHMNDLEIIEFDCETQDGVCVCKPIVRPRTL